MKFDDFVTGEIDELLQVQVGGSGDERQYLTQLTASEKGLTITAYQLAESGNLTKPESFGSYTVIDSLTLTESLSSQNSAPSTPEPAHTAPARPKIVWWQVGLIALAILLLTAVVLVILQQIRKKAKTNK